MVAKKEGKKKRITKKKKPAFNPLNLGHKKKVKGRWRKPRGTANKKRRRNEFAGALPNIGYKNPASVRGLRKDGRREVLVRNLKELNALKGKTEIVIMIGGSVGKKKKTAINEQAKEMGIPVINFREVIKGR